MDGGCDGGVLLALDFLLGLNFWTVDVKCAFLQSSRILPGDKKHPRRTIVRPPLEHPDRASGLYWVVAAALYGQKTAPRRWRRTIGNFLIGVKFVQCIFDDCVYYRFFDDVLCIVLVYVDDILCLSTDKVAQQVISAIADRFT